MKILFYIVHPAKYHLFRFTINELKKNHTVDIIINSKDVLEDLIINEGWEYTNIFPKGRNVSSKPSIIKSGLKFFLTVVRLEMFLFSHKKYDVFVTDDALVVNGWWRRIPTFIFNDNDIETIKINKILFYFAYKIISPSSTNLGKFTYKKLSFRGNKALAHLHPNYFTANQKTLEKYSLLKENYCVLRVSKLNATHDKNKNTGITNSDIMNFITMVKESLKVVVIAERRTPEEIKSLVFTGNPSEVYDLIYYSKFFIGDSGTMATEAAMMGVPNILINKLAKICGVHISLKEEYALQLYYDNFEESIPVINLYCESSNIKIEMKRQSELFIKNSDDLNLFLIKTITNE